MSKYTRMYKPNYARNMHKSAIRIQKYAILYNNMQTYARKSIEYAKIFKLDTCNNICNMQVRYMQYMQDMQIANKHIYAKNAACINMHRYAKPNMHKMQF